MLGQMSRCPLMDFVSKSPTFPNLSPSSVHEYTFSLAATGSSFPSHQVPYINAHFSNKCDPSERTTDVEREFSEKQMLKNEFGFPHEIVNNETTLDLITCQVIKTERSRRPSSAITYIDKQQMKDDFANHLNVEVAIDRIFKAGMKPPDATISRVEDATALARFYCIGQQTNCRVCYVVTRLKNHFAYYKSRHTCTHVAKESDALPPKLRMMIHKTKEVKEATKSIMINLDNMDKAQLNDVFPDARMDTMKKSKS